LASCYAENGDFFEQKKTKAAKHLSRSRTQKNSLVFFFAFCQSRLAKPLRRDPKKIRPPIFHQRAETCLTFRVLV